jgi:hypothetical protein
VLYLPPILNVHADSDELATLGRKLALSLDKFAASNSAIYESHAATVTVRDREEHACRLTRKEGPAGQPVPLADVFMVDYRPVLMERYRKAGLGQKILLAGLGLVVMLGKGLLALARQPFKVKRLRDRCQALYVLACFSVVFAYLALLLVTAVAVVHNTLDHAKRVDNGAPHGTNDNAAIAFTNQNVLDFGPAWPVLPVLPQSPGAQTWRTPPGMGEPLFPPAALPLWTTNGTGPGTVWEFASGEPESPSLSGWFGESVGAVWELVIAPVRFVWDLDAADAGLLLLVLTALGLAGGQGTGEPPAQLHQPRLRGDAGLHLLPLVHRPPRGDHRAGGRPTRRDHGVRSLRTLPGHRLQLRDDRGVRRVLPASEVRARRLDQVDTLVTIAAPYDFILTYWPRYFADRLHAPPAHLAEHLFAGGSPGHLLRQGAGARRSASSGCAAAASPHRRRGRTDRRTLSACRTSLPPGRRANSPSVKASRMSNWGMFGWMAMQGLGAHSRYWAKGEDGERNCFDLLVGGRLPGGIRAPGTGRCRHCRRPRGPATGQAILTWLRDRKAAPGVTGAALESYGRQRWFSGRCHCGWAGHCLRMRWWGGKPALAREQAQALGASP